MRARDRMPRGHRRKKSRASLRGALPFPRAYTRFFFFSHRTLARTRYIFLPHPLSRSNLPIVGFRSLASLVNRFLSRSLMSRCQTNVARSRSDQYTDCIIIIMFLNSQSIVFLLSRKYIYMCKYNNGKYYLFNGVNDI